MADISMCLNKECSYHKDCYRFQAIPNPYAQSYANWEYLRDDCFIPMSKKNNKDD